MLIKSTEKEFLKKKNDKRAQENSQIANIFNSQTKTMHTENIYLKAFMYKNKEEYQNLV